MIERIIFDRELEGVTGGVSKKTIRGLSIGLGIAGTAVFLIGVIF